jgi:hypothetical protein
MSETILKFISDSCHTHKSAKFSDSRISGNSVMSNRIWNCTLLAEPVAFQYSDATGLESTDPFVCIISILFTIMTMAYLHLRR